ncbi:MAG: hypothetical protein AAGA18_03945 [Verrucomicrobiota bacterium]
MKKLALALLFGIFVALSVPTYTYAHCGGCSSDKKDKEAECCKKKGEKECCKKKEDKK